jgi:small acid-soluble spore protein L (minor)
LLQIIIIILTRDYINIRSTINKQKNHTNRGTLAPRVTPQGYGQDAEFAEEPKSKLENAAKKKNTK